MATVNRLLSALLGLLLLVVGLATVVGMIVIASGRQPTFFPADRWSSWLRSTRIEDGRFLVIAAICALVGLILVGFELRRWPPDRVQTVGAAGARLWISRRSVQRRVNAAAARAGVEHARSRVRGKPGRWGLRLRGVAGPERREMVGSAIRAELDRLCAPPDVPVSLALRRPPRWRR
jgi:hypothetical protein